MYQRSYQIDYFCGWRYLFSPEYRNQARKKWGSNIMMRSLFMIGGFVSILLSSAAIILLAMTILQVIS